MSRALKPWSLADIKRRCRDLRERLTALSLATPTELAAYWPGGAENQEPGKGAWVYCYGQFAGMMRRLEKEQRDAQWSEASAARAQALVDAPIPVQLTTGDVRVHQLSYHSLEFLTMLDRTVLRIAELVMQVAEQRSEESERVLALEPMVRSHAVRLWCWVLTSGTEGGDLPFADDATDVEPPEWTRLITPDDLLTLWQAHRQLHSKRLGLIATLFPSTSNDGQRLSLAGFIGAYAHEHGGDAAVYMRRFSVGKIFAQAASAAEQMEAAKKKHAAPDPLAQLAGVT